MNNLAISENVSPIVVKKCNCRIESMVADEKTQHFDAEVEKHESKNKKGMNNFPLDVYNHMVEFCLKNHYYRNAMLMICMANWGMRFSDVTRVRFGHIINPNGTFKESFSLPNGEKKTSKAVEYYNNEAVRTIVELYLSCYENARKTRLDFLFVSESQGRNCPVSSVRDIEASDLYDFNIITTQKKLDGIFNKEKRLLNKYLEGKLSDALYDSMSDDIQKEKAMLNAELHRLNNEKKIYISPTPNADNIFIQTPISHTAGENIIKDTLKKIGINPKNRKNKELDETTDEKYNTHSLRKTFADWFILTGTELSKSDEFQFSETILELLKEKFKHSSRSVTTHYTDAQNKAFKTICLNMNIGLDVIRNFLKGSDGYIWL